MEQGSSNSLSMEDPLISKLHPNGWLPYWRINHCWRPHSAIIPVYLKHSIFPADRMANSGNALRANHALLAFQALPRFSGMVYCMVDKRFPNEIKIGESKLDAWARMRQSPWKKELGRVPHEHREVVFVLVCINIRSSYVETAFHRFFRFKGLQLDKSLGKGGEWFFADCFHIKAAVGALFRSNAQEIWIRGVARAYDTGSRISDDPPSSDLLGADFVIANWSKQGLRPQAVCM